MDPGLAYFCRSKMQGAGVAALYLLGGVIGNKGYRNFLGEYIIFPHSSLMPSKLKIPCSALMNFCPQRAFLQSICQTMQTFV